MREEDRQFVHRDLAEYVRAAVDGAADHEQHERLVQQDAADGGGAGPERDQHRPCDNDRHREPVDHTQLLAQEEEGVDGGEDGIALEDRDGA